ncbi:ATP-binding protein [Tautonia sp. JC769]|uniref:ATP-binding protein n=1 Tax=Tautonia sp. JC769 TaxID=3232135 RepID=UPI003459689B
MSEPSSASAARTPGDAPAPVRVLAVGRDGTLTCRILTEAGIDCAVASTAEELCREMESAQVLIVAEERLSGPDAAAIAGRLSRQPTWSDLPVVVVTRPGGRSGLMEGAVESLGNVSVLARPLNIEALVTVVRSGLRARRRQFQVRDLLRQRDEADRRKDEFLAMLAHELRNPLAPIRGAVGLLGMLDLDDPDLVEVRDVLDRQVRHMARLLDDLLDVSRITRGTIELRLRRVDLVEVARDAARMASTALEARRHAFRMDLPPGPVTVEADATRIEQVVSNLLSNAAKYTDPGGEVRLTLEHQPPDAVIRVLDDGVGIDPAVLPRVFDLFAQADQSLDRTQGGLGIGLTIVRRLVELHGGMVEAHSDGPGRGTEIVVRLPAMTGPRDDLPWGEDGSRRGGGTDGLRVLLVEDNRDGAALLARVLRHYGYEVRVAHDGASALGIAPDFRPQVVISDIGLPGIDGYELARRLRDQPGLGRPLLVAVTGYGQREDVARADDAGFDHHLIKPIDVTALVSLFIGPDGRASRQSPDGT